MNNEVPPIPGDQPGGTPAPGPRRQPRHRAGLVPLPWLFLLLVFSLGLAGMLIPRKSELVKRLVEDGRHDRAMALVGEGVDLGGIERPEDATPTSLVQIILDSISQDFDEASQERIESIIHVTDDPQGVREVLKKRSRIIPTQLLPEWWNDLAVRAVQTGNPGLAVEIYADLNEIAPLSLDQVKARVAACRFAGQPRKALDAVSQHLDTHQVPFTQLPEDLREMTVSLHRELNEGSAAFDLLSEEFRSTMDPDEQEELVELISTVAAQSSRIPDSLPILQTFLATTEAGKREWRELYDRQNPAPDDGQFRKFARMLAQNFEWNNRSSEAFDLHRKLAAMGDIEALDRCVTIYPWIDRQGDLTDLLELMVPVTGRDRYTLLLGRLLSERGQFAEAEAIYRAELAGKRAEDAAIWAELAGILDAQDRFTEARDTFLTAFSLDESQPKWLAQVARLQVTLGNHEAALSTYRGIPAEAHDRKTLEDFAMLAKSIDSPEDYIKAIRLKIATAPAPSSGNFLDITDACESLGDLERAESILREGLVLLPDSALLNLRLTDLLAKQGRKEEAFQLLASINQGTDKRYASRLLNLGYETGRFQETIQLITDANLNWSPSERFDLASLYEEIGNMKAALTQYRQAEGGETDVVRIEAEIAYMQGDIATAISRQKTFLRLLKVPDYEAWTFLGDLYRASNQVGEAETAYRTALEHLKKQLASQPQPSVAPPSVVQSP